MALATRELELVIIARDRASATLARVGGALTILGGAAARLGAEGIGFFVEATRESIDFRKQIALAFTQVEIAGATFDDVLSMVRESARQTSVPIDELAESAYDLFSTLDLESVDQAQALLDGFAQSAVAGQAPIRDIGRATIAWLNALDQAPTLENAQRIMDVQFELVRKGAGTYTEFAHVIGKAIPPFVAAGQGVEELGGSLAFLTRNGLSAAEAATSASRGVELLYSAKAIKGLRNIGIEVEDGTGKFRKLDDLLRDVVEHFSGLSDAERKLEFKEIFGEGRIQARRFFDLLMGEGNFEEFIALLGDVRDAAGGVAGAFDIMSAEPAVQLEVMRNRFQILKQEIGDVFIPLLTGKLLPLMDRLLDAWEDLDEIQRNNLVQWAAAATIFVTIGGAIASVVGAFILFFGVLQAFAGSAGIALLLGGGLFTAIAAIAGAATWALLDWESFEAFFGPMWERVLNDYLRPVGDWLQQKWPEAWAAAEAAYQGVVTFFQEDWPVIWDTVVTVFQRAWNNIVNWWNTNIKGPFEEFVGFLRTKAEEIGRDLESIFNDFWAEIQPIIDVIKSEFGPTLVQLGETALAVGKSTLTLVAVVVKGIAVIWNVFGTLIAANIANVLQLISDVINAALGAIEGGVNIITGLLTGDLGLAWEGVKQLGGAAADGFKAPIEAAANIVGNNIDWMGTKFEEWNTDLEGMGITAEEVNSFIAGDFDGLATNVGGSLDIIGADLEALGSKFDTVSTDADKALLTYSGALTGMVTDTQSTAGMVEGSLGRIRSAWWRTSDSIRRAIDNARYYYPRISPGTPSSPPPTKLVSDSLADIDRAFRIQLGSVERRVQRFSGYMRTQFSPDGFSLAERFSAAPVGITATGPSTQIGQQIDRQVTVEKVISQADAREIASEIAWQELNS